MKIENGLNPNCSEYVLRIYPTLSKGQKEQIELILQDFFPELKMIDIDKLSKDEKPYIEDGENYYHFMIVNNNREENAYYDELDKLGDHLSNIGISNSGASFQG